MKKYDSRTKKVSVKEQVYATVRDLIIRGEFEGGRFIEEEEITDLLGVSRTPVREAFFRLEAERFIDLIPRRGACVRQITSKEIIDIYETRRIIEIHAVHRICNENIDVPGKVFEIHEAMRIQPPNVDFYDHIINDTEFHSAIIESINNPVLLDVYRGIQARKMRVAYTALNLGPDRLEIIKKQHAELLESLVSKDGYRAEKVLQEHLWPVVNVISQLPS